VKPDSLLWLVDSFTFANAVDVTDARKPMNLHRLQADSSEMIAAVRWRVKCGDKPSSRRVKAAL
jgi:hypothetical protein